MWLYLKLESRFQKVLLVLCHLSEFLSWSAVALSPETSSLIIPISLFQSLTWSNLRTQNAICTLCICKFKIPTHTFPVNSRLAPMAPYSTPTPTSTVCLIGISNLSCQNLKSRPSLLVLLLYFPHVSWHYLHPSFLFVLHPISSHIHPSENLFAPSQRAALLYLEHSS